MEFVEGDTYSLLSQFTGTLVFAVSEEFDNTTLVWSESVEKGVLARVDTFAGPRADGILLETYPDTSLTISLTNAVRLLR